MNYYNYSDIRSDLAHLRRDRHSIEDIVAREDREHTPIVCSYNKEHAQRVLDAKSEINEILYA
jgi:hypothetical protein